MEFLRPRTSWHTVEAQQRALDTMGKLAALHADPKRQPGTSSPRKMVRIVPADTRSSGVEPVETPILRSRPRGKHRGENAPKGPSRTAPVLPGPSVRLVRPDDSAPPPQSDRRLADRRSADPRSADPRLADRRLVEGQTADGWPDPARLERGPLPVVPVIEALTGGAELLRFDALDDPPDNHSERHEMKASLGWGPAAHGQSATRRHARSVKVRRVGRAGRSRRRRSSLLATSKWGAALAVAVLLVVVIGLAGPGSRHRHQQTSRASANPPVTAGTSNQPQLSTGPSSPPPSSVPALTLASSGAGSASYRVSGPISVLLADRADCWVQLRNGGAGGAVIFEGVLHPGDSRTVAGPVWVRLGNPAGVAVSVDDQAVQVPSSSTPYNLSFS